MCGAFGIGASRCGFLRSVLRYFFMLWVSCCFSYFSVMPLKSGIVSFTIGPTARFRNPRELEELQQRRERALTEVGVLLLAFATGVHACSEMCGS